MSDDRHEEGIAEAITAAENALRELISTTFSARGGDWIAESGLSPERIARAEERRVEAQKHRTGFVDERLLYYTDLPDLETIITKQTNWSLFKPTLGDKQTFGSDMRRLNAIRVDQMHGRDLLPHEEAFARAISGEFRNRLTMLRSSKGADREYYPRIDQVTDSFGNTVRGHGSERTHVTTGTILKPGDTVRFRLAGWDPQGSTFSWQTRVAPGNQRDMSPPFRASEWIWTAGEDHVSDNVLMWFYLTSDRAFHRGGSYDDLVIFGYRVVPPDW